MFSPDVFQRALAARQGGGQGGPLGGMPDIFEPPMFNPQAQLDTSRMQDMPPMPIPQQEVIPGTDFQREDQPDILQILAMLLGQ